MDINGLHDDLLVKILSFLPTEVVVSTCVLSKRWEFLWMWLPNLEFTPLKYPLPEFWEFINKKLPLHKALVIETLRLHKAWSSHTKPEDIKRLIDITVSRHVRVLDIEYYCSRTENLFSLFTCKSLVTLKLKFITLMDLPSRVYLPSLKNFQLETESSFTNGKYLQQLLSNCPVLEDLSVKFSYIATLREFTIIVPSLQSLSLFLRMNVNLHSYEIDTPSLKYLKLVEWSYKEHYSLIKNMPKLKEAYVDVVSLNPKSVIGSITSVKRLTICSFEVVYGDGCVFKKLEHLNLCLCNLDSWNLLVQLLKGSPNLRVLDIFVKNDHGDDKRSGIVCWNKPSSVPECLLSSLQIFNWSGYLGRPQDRDIAVYILRNACHLKKATILADTRGNFVTKLQMIKELTLCPRASSTCQLVFPDDLDHVET